MQLRAEWTYKERTGETMGVVRRFEDGKHGKNGKPSKEIIPYFNAGNTDFNKGLPDHVKERRPLFGMEALKSVQEPVYIVEGEKCASALHGLGFQAVSWLGGTATAYQADWQALNGYKKAVILPDNDQAGHKAMQAVYNRLKALNQPPAITIVRFPELPIGGDICDYLFKVDGLYSWDTIDSLYDHPYRQTAIEALSIDLRALEKPVPPEWEAIESGTGLKAYSYRSFSRIEHPRREVLLAPWLIQSSINMVFAERGIGKTYYCLSCALALAEGRNFINYTAHNSYKVLYLDGEMQASLITERIRGLISNKERVNDNLFIITPDCQVDRDMPDLSKEDGLAEVNELINRISPDVIFVDNLSTFMRGGNENDGETWLLTQSWLIRQRSAGRAVILVHHTSKDGQQRGSSRKEDTMDVVIRLKRPDDYITGQEGARFEVHYTKHRNLYGEDIQPIEASLEERDGKQVWTWKKAGGAYEQAIELLQGGYSQSQICEELNIAKATMSRWRQKAQAEGHL